MQSRYTSRGSTSALTKDSTLHYSKRGEEREGADFPGAGGEERVWSINIYCNTQLVQAYRIF